MDKVQSDTRVLVQNEYPQPDGSTLVVPNDGVPTQVANPGRAVIRTLVANVVGLIVLLPTINATLEWVKAHLPALAAIPLVTPQR